MNFSAVKHIPKSSMAYAYDENRLHLYLHTAKDDIEKVEVIAGDPFDYEKIGNTYFWKPQIKGFIEMEKLYFNRYTDYWFVEIFTKSKRTKYAFILHTQGKRYFYGSRILKKITPEDNLYIPMEYFNFPEISREDLIDSPAWVKNTIWYQIFPERFARFGSQDKFLPWNSIQKGITNHHLFGGNLQGIISKLPYLNALGITGIYLTPIFEAYSAHKYDTIDYFKIDPQFGTEEDFRMFVQECHRFGIKVMLDAVFNHCGWFHPFFQDVIKRKKASPYWDCFFIEDEDFIDFPISENGLPILPENYQPKFRTFAKTVMMPKLNTANPFMENYLLDVAKYWIEKFDIDGWRLDVSNEVSHHFWRKFRTAVRSIKPDCYIVGENWDDANAWLRGDQFDAVMNYELAYPLWKFFGTKEEKIKSEEFVYFINDLLVKYPKNVAPYMYNLIDSHDTMRMLHRVGENKEILKLAYVFLFAFTGSPSIFYGDEIGLTGAHDPDCRRCMIWDEKEQDLELLSFFKKLIQIRKTNPDFQDVDLTWLSKNDNCLVFQKQNTIIIINNSDKPREFAFEYNLLDMVQETKVEQVHVQPYGYRILKILK
ncbi:MAG: glycoside hydrolase family 13 protein [Bacilli bacterium]|jgi:cyclomaltodextrinase